MIAKPRVALLIDADNSPASRMRPDPQRAVDVRPDDVLHEHAIRPIRQFDYSKGKNASDMAMVIDALDLLYADAPDAFGIVSSDADFTPLVMHLRAKGARH